MYLFNSVGTCMPSKPPTCKCEPPSFGPFCEFICQHGNISADFLS